MRQDLHIIESLITSNSKLLDVGCGDGSLIKHLAQHKNIDGRGIEIKQDMVRICVSNGLQVIQGDADQDLVHYPDKSFDYVISCQTLQATKNPVKVLQDMLRIGNQTIISIPNFGHIYNRFHLSIYGVNLNVWINVGSVKESNEIN
ncbi:MAG: methionine biosynthesis protein MetW, partial [Pseudomonadota bacterium]